MRQVKKNRPEIKHKLITNLTPAVDLNYINNPINYASDPYDTYHGTKCIHLDCGTREGERIGNEVTIKSIYIRGSIKYVPLADHYEEGGEGARAELLIYYDRAYTEDGTMPDPRNYFLKHGSYTNTDSNFNAPLSDEWKDRIKILCRRSMYFNADTRWKDVTWFKRMNMKVAFDRGYSGDDSAYPKNRQIFAVLRWDPKDGFHEEGNKSLIPELYIKLAYTDA